MVRKLFNGFWYKRLVAKVKGYVSVTVRRGVDARCMRTKLHLVTNSFLFCNLFGGTIYFQVDKVLEKWVLLVNVGVDWSGFWFIAYSSTYIKKVSLT